LSEELSAERIFDPIMIGKIFLNRLSELIPETRTDCFAWSLIPNHFHFLLRTGAVPIEVLMNRLLTGYSGWLNKKYKRNGQLFHNRYRSVLCQEDLYLKAGGYDFDCAVQRVAQVLNIRPDEVTAYGK
jgi:hypothetical protein